MYKYLRIIHVKNQNIPKNETIGHWMWSFFDDSENTLDAKLPQKWSIIAQPPILFGDGWQLNE